VGTRGSTSPRAPTRSLSLAATWARLLAPLIRPLDSLPRALRAQLPFPVRAFRAATALVERWRTDTTAWSARPREPFEIVAPAADGSTDRPRVWMGQGFEAGSTLAALVTATMAPDGPRLLVWRPKPAPRLPPALVGSPNTTAPGVPLLWNVARTLFFEQALFSEPATGGPATGIDTVFLSWGEHRGQGRSVAAALHSLLASGSDAPAARDTALAARWRRAQQLAAEADAALAAGNLERFGHLYSQLKEVLGLGRRKLAPTPERR